MKTLTSIFLGIGMIILCVMLMAQIVQDTREAFGDVLPDIIEDLKAEVKKIKKYCGKILLFQK